MATRLSALGTGRRLIPQKQYFTTSGTHFCKILSKPQGPLRPSGLGKLTNVIHLIGSRTRDLPPCSVVRVIAFIVFFMLVTVCDCVTDQDNEQITEARTALSVFTPLCGSPFV
jgi:hypothetical protein